MLPIAALAARPGLVIAAAIGLALASWGTWQWWHRQAAERALLEFQAASAAVITQRLEHNATLERDHAQRIAEVSHDYQTRIAQIRARYAAAPVTAPASMRDDAPDPGRHPLPADPGATARADESAGPQPEPEACELEAAKLAALQRYVCGIPAEVCPGCAVGCK